MANKRRSRPAPSQTDENDARGHGNRSTDKGSVIIESNHGPNPVGMNPNRGLPPDDPNVGSPCLSTVYDVVTKGKGKYVS